VLSGGDQSEPQEPDTDRSRVWRNSCRRFKDHSEDMPRLAITDSSAYEIRAGKKIIPRASLANTSTEQIQNMQTTDLQFTQPTLDLEICIDADTCAAELKRCADEADRCAALAQAGAELAIRHAWNGGAVCLKAKQIIPHGEFQNWLEVNAAHRGYRTLARWMKLAKVSLESLLSENPQLKGLQDAYVCAGVLPEPEAKEDSGESQKERPPYVLSFKSQYSHASEWDRDDAKDFLYEFDRLARLAVELKTEFGL
jgi:hypothetical protein